jgi:cysteinyl-tRNA synthetase
MQLKLYNTLTRKKDFFKPIEKIVRMYGCGPTVYWYQHIGNLRRYLFEDILLRTLLFNGYKVKHVINITDVGHLSSDADEGEDKIEKASKKEKKTAKEIADYYFNVFYDDLKKINFTEPDFWPKATEHIKEQIELIKKLEKKGFTYKTSDGIYFNTSKFEDYGNFARLNIKGLQAGKRVSIGEKKNKTDFALWKFSETPGIRQQEWDSPWGIGFPGWHIECSAMSSKYLGEQYDIHTGGIDHINIHHTNEIAQSEGAFGKKPWVNYWIHCNHLVLKEGKMSKSSGEIIRLKTLENKGYSPLEYRYLCLLTHYRKKIEFDFKIMDSAKITYKKLKNSISEIKDNKKINKEYLEKFKDAINNDLNTPKALQILWKLIKDKKAEGKIKTIEKMDEVLGLDLLKKEKIEIPNEIKKLVEERENSRRKKDWSRADNLRKKIKEKGWIVEDYENKFVIRKR